VSGKPNCSNCGQPYADHLWRSSKGACKRPLNGRKTFYLDPTKSAPISAPKGGAA